MNRILEFKLRQKRSFGEVFNGAFEFLKLHYKNLFLIMGIIAGPGIFLIGGLLTLFYYQFKNIFEQGDTAAAPSQVAFIMAMVLVAIGVLMVAYTLTHLTVLSYVKISVKQPENITTEQVWKSVKKDFFPYLLYLIIGGSAFTVVYFVAVFALVIFSFVPLLNVIAGLGIFALFVVVAVYFYFFLTLMILEDAPIEQLGKKIKKSHRLLKGDWWATFGIMALFYLIVNAISNVFYIPVYALIFIPMATGYSTFDPATEPTYLVVLLLTSFGLVFIVGLFLQSIQIIGVALQYYSLSEKKDADSLMSEISSIDTSSASRSSQFEKDSEPDETF